MCKYKYDTFGIWIINNCNYSPNSLHHPPFIVCSISILDQNIGINGLRFEQEIRAPDIKRFLVRGLLCHSFSIIYIIYFGFMNREKIASKKDKHFSKIVQKDVCVHLIFAMVASA